MAADEAGMLANHVLIRIVDHAAALGHDAEQLCRHVGLSLEQLQAPDARVPFVLGERLCTRTLELVGDVNFGLHLAASAGNAKKFDAGGLLMMASPTLRAAIERLERFQRYWGDGAHTTVYPIANGLCLRYQHNFKAPELARHTDECALAQIVLGGGALLGQALVARVVRFPHEAPADIREHQALFRCPIEFGAPYAEVELDQRVLDLPLPHANEAYRAIFQDQVERALAGLPGRSGTTDNVRCAALALLASGDCSLAETARALGVSARTMQRRLQADGTSFEELVDAMRHELALKYLDQEVPIQQIAWLLGYADASTFHRAWKRWTGTTPERTRTARRAAG